MPSNKIGDARQRGTTDYSNNSTSKGLPREVFSKLHKSARSLEIQSFSGDSKVQGSDQAENDASGFSDLDTRFVSEKHYTNSYRSTSVSQTLPYKAISMFLTVKDVPVDKLMKSLQETDTTPDIAKNASTDKSLRIRVNFEFKALNNAQMPTNDRSFEETPEPKSDAPW